MMHPAPSFASLDRAWESCRLPVGPIPALDTWRHWDTAGAAAEGRPVERAVPESTVPVTPVAIAER
jgi:hypothetical protein